MSGNLAVESECVDVETLGECLRKAFPGLDANWESFLDPKNGNIAQAGKPLITVGDRDNDRDNKANIRLPKELMGTRYDLGLYEDPVKKTWSLVGSSDDIGYGWGRSSRIKSGWNSATVDYTERKLLEKAKAGNLNVTSTTETDSKAIPSHIAAKLKAGKIRVVKMTVDSDALGSGVIVSRN